MAHEALKLQYAKDAEISTTPHLAWQFKHDTAWKTCYKAPKWAAHNQYRRHPHADLILTYDRNTVYELQAADNSWKTVSNPPLWDEKLNYRKKPMAQEELKAQYEKDRTIYSEPHLLWEFSRSGPWETLTRDPSWSPDLRYRRKPEARPHAHLIHIWANGGEIQVLRNNTWRDCPTPCWGPSRQYRQKPATQTRFIPIFRTPADTVYVGEDKITLADCNSSNQDTLISALEITVDKDNNVTLVKKHKCLMTSMNKPNFDHGVPNFDHG